MKELSKLQINKPILGKTNKNYISMKVFPVWSRVGALDHLTWEPDTGSVPILWLLPEIVIGPIKSRKAPHGNIVSRSYCQWKVHQKVKPKTDLNATISEVEPSRIHVLSKYQYRPSYRKGQLHYLLHQSRIAMLPFDNDKIFLLDDFDSKAKEVFVVDPW